MVPALERLVEPRLQLIPVEGAGNEDSVTVQVNPFRKLTVILEFAVEPVATEMVAGLAVRLKSASAKVTVAVWTVDPLVPGTVTV